MPFLPYGRQYIDDDDIAAVTEALRSEYLTTGPFIDSFERAFAETVGSKFAIVSNSGTAALHIAAAAAGIGPGDGVIVPTVTFLATANVIRYLGAEVVFADVDPRSGLLTEEHLKEALYRLKKLGLKAKAVLPVHLNGPSVDMIGIRSIAEKEGLKIIEDACHALGSKQIGGNGSIESVGACALSDFACFSLHPVKTITMGEGGVTTTKDANLAQKMTTMRSHGMVRDPAKILNRDLGFDSFGATNPWYYEMHEPGFNYRATDFACALGISQLKKLKNFAICRKALAARYDQLLSPLAPMVRPVSRLSPDIAVLHLYAVQIDFASLGRTRSQVMQWLKDRGIGTMVHYIPVHHQPYYAQRYGKLSLPDADGYYSQQLSIPFYPAMTDEDVSRVVDTLTELVQNRA